MGSATSGGRRRGGIAGINVTPLVDVTLVLLLIFMVTAKIVVVPAVPLELPGAHKTESVQVLLSVVVPAEGLVQVDGLPVSDEAGFLARARRVRSEHPEVRAIIHAEATTPHARVLESLDRLRRAGIEHVAFAARALEGPADAAEAFEGSKEP